MFKKVVLYLDNDFNIRFQCCLMKNLMMNGEGELMEDI